MSLPPVPSSWERALTGFENYLAHRHTYPWFGRYVEGLRQAVLAELPAAAADQSQALNRVIADPALANAMLDQGVQARSDALLPLLRARSRDASRALRHAGSYHVELPPLEEAWALAQRLLDAGADPNAIAEHPLGIGPYSVLEECVSGRWEDHEEGLRWIAWLVDRGARVDVRGHPQHGPPLELALRHKTFAAARLLLDLGADPAHLPGGGFPSGAGRHAEVVRAWLLEQGTRRARSHAEGLAAAWPPPARPPKASPRFRV